MSKITIDLEVAEALTALTPLQAAMLSAMKSAAETTGEEHEIAQLTARFLNRTIDKISQALYPECQWLDNEPCPLPVRGQAGGLDYCGMHLARIEAQVAQRQLVSA